MKIYFVLICVPIFCLIGCASPPSQPTGQIVSDGWYPGEKLYPAEKHSVHSQLNLPEKRKGKTPDGFAYTIFNDGSAGIRKHENIALDGWDIDCR